jgi:hypothetical protein
MNKKKEIKGLYRDFAAEPMTPEEWERAFFRNSPEAAYKEVVLLRGLYGRAMESAKELQGTAMRLLEALIAARGAEKVAAELGSQIRTEKKKIDATDREAGNLGNIRRAARFEKQLLAFMADVKPGTKATTIADLIAQAIEMDTARIRQAKNDGERWQALDLKFERKNIKGHPYTRGYALERIRDLRKQ